MRRLHNWLGAGRELAPGVLANAFSESPSGGPLDGPARPSLTVYTFYMCNPDGSSNTLEAFALGSDEQAGECAVRMIAEHLNCAYVAVFDNERPVLARHRVTPIPAVRFDAAAPGDAFPSLTG